MVSRSHALPALELSYYNNGKRQELPEKIFLPKSLKLFLKLILKYIGFLALLIFKLLCATTRWQQPRTKTSEFWWAIYYFWGQYTNSGAMFGSLIHTCTNHYYIDKTLDKHNTQLKILLPSSAPADQPSISINTRRSASTSELAILTAHLFLSSWTHYNSLVAHCHWYRSSSFWKSWLQHFTGFRTFA